MAAAQVAQEASETGTGAAFADKAAASAGLSAGCALALSAHANLVL
jgi:hypothetical protein